MMESDVIELGMNGKRVNNIVARNGSKVITAEGDFFISSMPLSELILKMKPAPPPTVVEAARRLTYRDFLTVALIIRRDDLFPDNWIYIHSPEVKVGRIQNFKNWSPDMIPASESGTTCIGLEYFCSEGDDLWQMSDDDLVKLGQNELAQIGLALAEDVIDGVVYRQAKAYPVYMGAYQADLDTIKAYIESLENLQSAGRNGLHMYNNQDHSMLTAMLAVKNILGGQHDIWSVNTERSYHEEVRISKPAPSSPRLREGRV